MVQIKVILGTCGIEYTDAYGNARHTTKAPESGPFQVDDALAARLVGRGVAVYVDASKAAPAAKMRQEDPAAAALVAAAGPGHLAPADLELMEFNELRKLAADMGVKPAGKKKADYIAAIAAAEVGYGDEEDADELPDLNAADPE